MLWFGAQVRNMFRRELVWVTEWKTKTWSVLWVLGRHEKVSQWLFWNELWFGRGFGVHWSLVGQGVRTIEQNEEKTSLYVQNDRWNERTNQKKVNEIRIMARYQNVQQYCSPSSSILLYLITCPPLLYTSNQHLIFIKKEKKRKNTHQITTQ